MLGHHVRRYTLDLLPRHAEHFERFENRHTRVGFPRHFNVDALPADFQVVKDDGCQACVERLLHLFKVIQLLGRVCPRREWTMLQRVQPNETFRLID